MTFRTLTLTFLLLGTSVSAQHKGYSYELQNEVGTHELVSLTVTVSGDNRDGITYVINKHKNDTLYHIDEYLNGWVGLSRDGQTIAHLVSEKGGKPLSESVLAFYRGGQKFDEAKLSKLISYELSDALGQNRLPKSGWLKNDSVYHRMASNPFFVSEDKLFISFAQPILSVFDMNQMFHIYTGNGANHFTLNYYSIPNAPYRTNYDWGEYLPTEFPELETGKNLRDHIAKLLELKSAMPEESVYRATIEIKLLDNGTTELLNAAVYGTLKNDVISKLTDKLTAELTNLEMETSLLPPRHPAWIFKGSFWLK